MSRTNGRKPKAERNALALLPADIRPGDDVLSLVDGRSLPARDLRRRVAELYADLGGADVMSHAQQSLVLRVANLETFIATREAHLLKTGFKVDDEFMRVQLQAVGMLLQLYSKIGLKRVPKEVPSLQQYLAEKAREKAAAQDQPTNKEEQSGT